MRWSVPAALVGMTANVVACFTIDNEELASWLTPPLLPLIEDADTPDLFKMSDCFGFKLEEATIDEMQEAMEDGKLTSVQLVLCYMMRAHQTQQYIK